MILIIIIWILLAATVLDYSVGWLDETVKSAIEALGGK